MYAVNGVKTCSSCRVDKTVDLFYKSLTLKDGLTSVCKECQSISAKKSYQRNRDAALNRAKKWAYENRGRRREIANRYDQNNKPAKAISAKKRMTQKRLEDVEMVRLNLRQNSFVRRAKFYKCQISATVEDVIKVLSDFNGVCAYCENTFSALAIDHYVAFNNGGAHEKGNMVACCKSCNASKRIQNADDWVINKYGENTLRRIKAYLSEEKVNA